jgi:hypothetical protein
MAVTKRSRGDAVPPRTSALGEVGAGHLKGRAGRVWAENAPQALQPSEQAVGPGAATTRLPLVTGWNLGGLC